MSNLKRTDIAKSVSDKIGLPKNISSDIVDTVFNVITQSLTSGNDVKIAKFGVFFLRKKSPRSGRNPKTGTEITISERVVCGFRSVKGKKSSIKNDTK